jgi:hypothetical protein
MPNPFHEVGDGLHVEFYLHRSRTRYFFDLRVTAGAAPVYSC